ncbi:MAG: hypothetical protein LBS47_00685 [Endomicrobium sp.]|jgi:hypothetical protein|nr:hypothetical protein [Endomicrobium sp.]
MVRDILINITVVAMFAIALSVKEWRKKKENLGEITTNTLLTLMWFTAVFMIIRGLLQRIILGYIDKSEILTLIWEALVGVVIVWTIINSIKRIIRKFYKCGK